MRFLGEGGDRRAFRRHWALILGIYFCLLSGILLSFPHPALTLPGFDVKQMSDMSDFDPNNPTIPTGDTIKVALMQVCSGAAAANGEGWWLLFNWVAHDLNKRGGILVNGKRKKIQVIQADTQGKPAVAKEMAERLCLEEKVHVIVGTSGSHIALAIQQVAGKHKVIFMNCGSLSDDLMNGKNFNRYTFRTYWNTTMAGVGMAYFFSQRPERRFYLFCQDYLYGHDLAQAFREGLKKYKPNAEIVGEAYHPLWAKDFAPYLTKIKGSGAEVIFTGDWEPDAGNMLKQARELGIKLPFATLYMDHPNSFSAVGPAGTAGLLRLDQCLLNDDNPQQKAFLYSWNRCWKQWKRPYNSQWYRWQGSGTAILFQMYWLMDVIRRAGSTDPERIIKTWEGDEWNSLVGPLKMRACDHQAVMDLFATEFVYPNKWFEDFAYYGKIIKIPSKHVTPPVPEDLERCRK